MFWKLIYILQDGAKDSDGISSEEEEARAEGPKGGVEIGEAVEEEADAVESGAGGAGGEGGGVRV